MALEELKEKQGRMWGSGPYERIGATISDVHEAVLARLDPQPGERFLDIATGTGELARPAARRGADVTAVDLAPVMIETAKRRAAEDGVTVGFAVGDAENLAFAAGSFDVVASTCGVMFAPNHASVASELARVCRPGGRLGLATWKPDGGVAEFFKTIAPYQPPSPAGVGNPFDWGREDHATELLGDSFELTFEAGNSVHEESSGEAMWELFSTSYGPVKALAESLDADRREQLHADYVALAEKYRTDDGVALPREYLLIFGRRK